MLCQACSEYLPGIPQLGSPLALWQTGAHSAPEVWHVSDFPEGTRSQAVELKFEPGGPAPASTQSHHIAWHSFAARWGAAVQILVLLLTSAVVWAKGLDIPESPFLS